LNWSASNTGISNPNIYTIATDGTNLYAGAHNGDVFVSTNNGSSWTAHNLGTAALIQSIVCNGSSILAGTDNGVFLSVNAGVSWTAVNNGLGSLTVMALGRNGNAIFAATANGMYLTTNNGTNWTAINNGISPAPFNSVSVAGNDVYIGGMNGVFKSVNNGSNWTAVNTGLPVTYVNSLKVAGNYVYAGIADMGVWKLPLSVANTLTDVEDLQNIEIYPVPADNYFMLKASQSHGGHDFLLSDYMGNKILTGQLGHLPLRIETSHLQAGVYFFSISGTAYTGKITVVHD